MRKKIPLLFVISALALSIGCTKEEKAEEMPEMATLKKAAADMGATSYNYAHGTVTFMETDGGIRVIAHFEGVPAGEHGFHIHEYGDCSSRDGKSAGGHFNPAGTSHAGRDDEERHVGDLGNITADEDGVAHADFIDAVLSFEGDASIIGKGVILHADPDDMTTQPTGNAGGRISCGVIEMSEAY